ncbi:hypothetical protein ABT174_14795 [Streptomyces sparsogenes]|uniref:hypothetical protein n=1 Tax=Streptomyces sparsogenes TaxID=67365 RepID=UPI003328C26C
MTGHRRGPVPLPPPPPPATVDHALAAARRCACGGVPRPATLREWAAVLGHARGAGPFEARPGESPGLLGPVGDTLVTAGAGTPVPTGSYAYDPLGHRLVPRGADPARSYDRALALRSADGTGEAVERVRLVAAAAGLCAHPAPGDPDTLLLYARAASPAPSPTSPRAHGPAATRMDEPEAAVRMDEPATARMDEPAAVRVDDALAALPVRPPAYTTAPARPPTARVLLTLLRGAAPIPPYRLTVNSVAGLEPGVYRADTGPGPLEPVWRGPTAPYAHVLTRGGHPAAAALAHAAAVVHLLGGGPPRSAEALRLRVAAFGAGLTAWCDDAPAPAAAAFLGLAPGAADVVCHITLGHAPPEPRLRVPVRFAFPGALP